MHIRPSLSFTDVASKGKCHTKIEPDYSYSKATCANHRGTLCPGFNGKNVVYFLRGGTISLVIVLAVPMKFSKCKIQ